MRRVVWTDEKIDRLRREIAAGYSMAEISRRMKMSLRQIYKKRYTVGDYQRSSMSFGELLRAQRLEAERCRGRMKYGTITGFERF